MWCVVGTCARVRLIRARCGQSVESLDRRQDNARIAHAQNKLYQPHVQQPTAPRLNVAARDYNSMAIIFEYVEIV